MDGFNTAAAGIAGYASDSPALACAADGPASAGIPGIAGNEGSAGCKKAGGGNRCGHDPRKTIPSLDLANGKDRQQRSERREACLSVLGGRRAERAIADLVEAGLVTVHPLCQRKDDLTFKGYAAIRTVSATVFALFGLGRWLPHEREKAAARLKKKQRRQEAAELAKVKLALGGLANHHKGQSAAQGGAAAQNPPQANGPKGPLEYLADIKAMLNGKGPPP